MTASKDSISTRQEHRLEKLSLARQMLSNLDNNFESNGLTAAQVAQRIALGLTNKQHNDSSRSFWSILRGNLFTLFNMVVGLCFVVLLVLGQWKDALFGLVVVSNILIGIVQEFRSKRALDKLALLHAPKARVLRSAEITEVDLEALVLDDLLELRPGDQVLADAQVLTSHHLEVDESLLTGESEPVLKVAGDEVLAGSGIASGKAQARVIRIASETFAHRLALEARRFSLVNSELRNALNRIVKWITWVLVPIMLIVINGQMQAHGGWQKAIDSGQWLDALVRSVAAIISMIPQGLVLLTSIAFAVSAVKLTRSNVLVQELAAVEGLARVDVVCFDKTGTLTEGEIDFEAATYVNEDTPTVQDWRSVLAHFGADPDANATAKCLASHFENAHLKADATTAFSSATKWSSFTFGQEEWVLGAPELVLHESSKALVEAARLSATGRRTLALALNKQAIALLTFKEKIRSDAMQTLEYFKAQGVSIRIISGDNHNTVAAVARDAGLEGQIVGVDGKSLPESINELAEVLETNYVFGRVTPEQKRNMVLALQSKGHVVAMTGDGVNDALALKKADLGIAMGSGASSTKAVANLVLLDGKFSSLPGVVSEGRRVIANVERVSRLFLNKTVWAMTLGLVFGVLLWQFPFLPRQLSIVDAFTIGIPAFALALLPNQKRYLPGFLKRSLSFCVPAGLVVALGLIVQQLVISPKNWLVAQQQTATALLLSITGLWVLAALARPLGGLKLAILLTMFGLTIVTFFWQPLIDFYGFDHLNPNQWMITLLIGSVCAALIELTHQLVARKFSRV